MLNAMAPPPVIILRAIAPPPVIMLAAIAPPVRIPDVHVIPKNQATGEVRNDGTIPKANWETAPCQKML